MVLGHQIDKEIDDKIRKGRLDEAEEYLNELNLEEYAYQLYHVKIAHDRGHYNKVVEICKKLQEEIVDTRLLLSVLYWLSWGYLRQSKYQLSIENAERGLNLIEVSEDNFDLEKAYLLKAIAVVTKEQGNVVESLKLNEQALHLAKSMGDTELVCALTNNIASTNYFMGNYNKALSQFHEVNRRSSSLGYESIAATSRLNLGEVYAHIGDYKLAIDFLENALAIYRQKNNTDRIASCYRKIAETHLHMGKLDLADQMIDLSLEIYETLDNNFFHALTLWVKIKVLLGLAKNPTNELKKLETISNQSQNKILEQLFQIATATILKEESSLFKKGQALLLLEKILEAPSYLFELTFEASILYSDLLLQEYILSKERRTLTRVEHIIDNILEKAKVNYAHVKVVESLIIKSKVRVVVNDYTGSLELLEMARQICLERGLNVLQEKVEQDAAERRISLETLGKTLETHSEELDDARVTNILEYMNSILQTYQKSKP